jgi:hypothetical protein
MWRLENGGNDDYRVVRRRRSRLPRLHVPRPTGRRPGGDIGGEWDAVSTVSAFPGVEFHSKIFLRQVGGRIFGGGYAVPKGNGVTFKLLTGYLEGNDFVFLLRVEVTVDSKVGVQYQHIRGVADDLFTSLSGTWRIVCSEDDVSGGLVADRNGEV